MVNSLRHDVISLPLQHPRKEEPVAILITAIEEPIYLIELTRKAPNVLLDTGRARRTLAIHSLRTAISL